MNFKNEIALWFNRWREAISGKHGLLKSLIALVVFAVIIGILSVLVVVLPLLAHLTLFVLFIAVVILAISPTLVRLSFNSKPTKHQPFVRSKEKLVILKPNGDTPMEEINLTTSFAHITVQWYDENSIEVELKTEYATLEPIGYLWEEKGNVLNFMQGSNPKNVAYSLVLRLPKTLTNITLNARLIEGSFNIEEEGKLKTLRLEAVNSTIGLANSHFDICKLYGLNLVVNTVALKFNQLVVRSTGGTFNLGLAEEKRGAKMKTASALCSIKLGDQVVGVNFKADTSELWAPVDGETEYIHFDFNLLNSNVDISR